MGAIKLLQSIKNHLGFYVLGAMASGLLIGTLDRPPFLRFFIPVALFMMLYPMMLDTGLKKIGKVVRRPGILVLSLIINFGFCPLLITALTHLLRLDTSPALTIGLLLYATIPCGGMVPAFTGILNGNLTLSITITAVSLLISIIMVPFWTSLLISEIIAVPVMLIAKYLFLMIIFPLALAGLSRRVVTRKWGKSGYQNFSVRMKDVTGLGLTLLCFIMFVLNGNVVLQDPGLILKILLPIVSFLLILLIGTTLWCKLAKVAKEDAIALTISSSAKNNALSLALAIAVFGGEVGMINTIAGPMVQLPIMITYLKLNKAGA